MNKFYTIFSIFILISCSKDSGKAIDILPEDPDLPVTQILIDVNNHRQLMDGIGAACYTFPFANDIGWNWSKVKFVFDELDIHYIRIAPWFNFWEDSNDNQDPYSINWQAFDRSGITASHDLGLAQYAVSKGIEVDLGIWSVGEWMLKSKDPNIVDPAKYPELGESIATYIKYMQDHGVEIKVVEVQNEPNINAGNQYESPENLLDATAQVVDQLNRNGLQRVMLHTPNLATPDDTRNWGSPILNNDSLQSRIAAISYHTWWVDQFTSYDDIRKLGEEFNKPVWATEMGYCALADGCFGDTHFLKPETWGTAWDYAMSYYRAIDWSRAGRLYHWTILGHDAVVSPDGNRLASFWILKHYANFIPAGSFYLQGDPGDNNLLCMPFELPDRTWSAIVINQGTNDKFIRMMHDVPFTITESVQTTKTAYYRIQAQTKNKNGEDGYLIPAQSISSFKME
jgi:hypothetical protein